MPSTHRCLKNVYPEIQEDFISIIRVKAEYISKSKRRNTVTEIYLELLRTIFDEGVDLRTWRQ